MARVCKRWRTIAYDTRLWKNVSLRPEVSGLHVGSLESLLALISVRFGPSLRYIELPIELITHTVLHELAAKCPNLTHMLLDFSTAMQLHDFSEMQAFPTKLRYMCICLSEVIFMEGFMRKIYNFINGLEVLHLLGTYEKCEEEEEEIVVMGRGEINKTLGLGLTEDVHGLEAGDFVHHGGAEGVANGVPDTPYGH